MSMEIKPSNIFYSHDTIMYRFRKRLISTYFFRGRRRSRHSAGIPIGETLDSLCDGDCKIEDIPKISITKKDGKWYTLDNRRLWVFHHYESFLHKTQNKLLTVPVDVVAYDEQIHGNRFTTTNGGVTIQIKGGHDPTGKWHKEINPVTPKVEEEQEGEEISDEPGPIVSNTRLEEVDSNASSDTELSVKDNILSDNPSDFEATSSFMNTDEENNKNRYTTNTNSKSNDTKWVVDIETSSQQNESSTEMMAAGGSTNVEISRQGDLINNMNSGKKNIEGTSNDWTSRHVMGTIINEGDNGMKGTLMHTDEIIEPNTSLASNKAETNDEVQTRKRSLFQLEDTDSEEIVLYKRQKQNEN